MYISCQSWCQFRISNNAWLYYIVISPYSHIRYQGSRWAIVLSSPTFVKFGNFVIIDLKSNINWDFKCQMFQVLCTFFQVIFFWEDLGENWPCYNGTTLYIHTYIYINVEYIQCGTVSDTDKVISGMYYSVNSWTVAASQWFMANYKQLYTMDGTCTGLV